MITGLALFVGALLARALSVNRHVRARLMASAVVFAADALLAAAIERGVLSADMQQQVGVVPPLLLVFGIINALVAVFVNPWRVDRLPDRFPTIVQDVIVIGLFAVGATVILQEKIFATTAVGAVVIGFALQDTLGNLFAGLAIQIEKPFRVGQWVRIADIDGQVSEITWRACKVRTKSGNFVIVPNSKLADDIIINYSEPTRETRIEVEVGTSYDNPPNDVKHAILSALQDDLAIQAVRAPEVLVDNFGDSSITYRIRVWTTEFDADERIRDRIRTALYYGFRRTGIVIPYPIQTEIQKEDTPPPPRDFSQDEALLKQVAVFASLDGEECARLVHATRCGLFGAGEAIVREGEAGSSMYVVIRGQVAVTLAPDGREVARIKAGGFFGEMSLLTGAPRTATVRTVEDSELMEIALDPFRRFVLANPSAVEQIGAAVAARQVELNQHRAAGPQMPAADSGQNVVDRIRRFLLGR